ncbi:ATP-binding protein [bacterium]|nr:ATP-binding protein [bacterium]
MHRKQTNQIIKDLNKKMVFLVGPRQVGKTWLAKEIGKKYQKTVYLNYDRLEDREIIKNERWLESTELLILDELHKMPGWKNFLKGVYDTKKENIKILITGSARLETFRQTGDSLAGRFYVHRLMPFSMAELIDSEYGNDMERFMTRGGFPEPFLSSDETGANRWRNQYIDGLVRDDVLDFEKIYDLKAVQMVFELLRRKVSSPVSYTSIAQDAGISPITARKYIQIFEALYIVFRVSPYSKNIARSILKGSKIYFYDNGLVVGGEGAKFENFVAVSLLKHTLAKNDMLGENNQLKYLRTKEGKEIDFCLANTDNDIEKIIETKKTDGQLSKNLKYFSDKYNLKAEQVVKELKRERVVDNIKIVKANSYLKELFL